MMTARECLADARGMGEEMIDDMGGMVSGGRKTGGDMSPNKGRKELKATEKARLILEELKRNGPGELAEEKLHSKKELIRNLAANIRELRAEGHSYESIMNGLAKGGITIKESTLKKYLNAARKPRRKKARNVIASKAEVSAPTLKVIVPPLLQPDKPIHPTNRSDGSFAVLPDEAV